MLWKLHGLVRKRLSQVSASGLSIRSITIKERGGRSLPISIQIMKNDRVDYRNDSAPRRTITLLHVKSRNTINYNRRTKRWQRTLSSWANLTLLSRNLPAFVEWDHSSFVGIYTIFISRRHAFLVRTSAVSVHLILTSLSGNQFVFYNITELPKRYNMQLLSYSERRVVSTLLTTPSHCEVYWEVRRCTPSHKSRLLWECVSCNSHHSKSYTFSSTSERPTPKYTLTLCTVREQHWLTTTMTNHGVHV